ncbi:MAG: TIGR02147 family protein [Chitinivibrionales bacterium]|nr:TIGR02147 family protein [Chitinivibrionales bacterium]
MSLAVDYIIAMQKRRAGRRSAKLNINIFCYTDFRKYLADRYREMKWSNPSLTYRHVATHIGFNSPGFFTQIIQGKSNLPESSSALFASFFDLNKKETEYFQLLVRYNQATDHFEKKKYFAKILTLNRGKLKELTPEQFKLFDKWYYLAIHELLYFFPFKDDYKALAKKLNPSITPSQARDAIQLLAELGLISKQDNGIWTRAHDCSLTTGYHDESIIINNYLLETMELAKEAIQQIPHSQRSCSSITLSLSEKGQQRLHNELDMFRRRLLEIARGDTDEDRICQVNLQLFPLSNV